VSFYEGVARVLPCFTRVMSGEYLGDLGRAWAGAMHSELAGPPESCADSLSAPGADPLSKPREPADISLGDFDKDTPKAMMIFTTLHPERLQGCYGSAHADSLRTERRHRSLRTHGALRKARREAEEAAKVERAASVSVWPDEGKYNKRSLFLFTLQSPIRQMLIRWIEWRFWDTKVIGIIMLNTLTLAMFDCFDKPSMRACAQEDANLPPGPYGYCNKMTTGKYFPQYLGRDVQDILGKLFSAYFTFEMLVQVVAKGLCVGHKTFLTDAANWLDAFIVGVGIMDFVPSDSEGGSLSALRALRVLRPLRAVRVLFLKSPLH
jgi:hypothetical protein